MLDRKLRGWLLRPPKICIPLRTSPKKSKKRQAKTLLSKIRCARIALAAPPAGFVSSWIFQKSIKNLSFRCGRPQKSRKNVKREHVFQKRPFRGGRPQKSRKNVKRKHCSWKFDAPVSHLRPSAGAVDFWPSSPMSNFWSKTDRSVADVP